MPAPKGRERPPGSGRKAGTPNKTSQAVRETVAGLLGRDVIVELCERYKSETDDKLAVALLREIASYCLPKLKAIEHTGKDGESLIHPIVIFDIDKSAKEIASAEEPDKNAGE